MNSLVMMRSPRQTAALFIAIICLMSICCVPAVSAWNVSKISVEPGTLTPGTPVLVSVRVDFPAEGSVTFKPANELQFTTDLTRAKWYYILILDGVEKRCLGFCPGYLEPNSTLSGRTLSYPDDVTESLSITLEGLAPAVQHTTNITILKIDERDSRSFHAVKSYEYTAPVVNITDIKQITGRVESNLSQLRVHIDEMVAKGVNTTEAEKKYETAKSWYLFSCLDSSDSPLTRFNSCQAAESAITEGEALLDNAWAGKPVADAEVKVAKADVTTEAVHANLNSVPVPVAIPVIAVLGTGIVMLKIRKNAKY